MSAGMRTGCRFPWAPLRCDVKSWISQASTNIWGGGGVSSPIHISNLFHTLPRALSGGGWSLCTNAHGSWGANNKLRLHQASFPPTTPPPNHLIACTQHTDQLNACMFHKEADSLTSSRAFKADGVRAPDENEQWMDRLAVAFNTGTEWHRTRTHCESTVLFLSSKPLWMRRGDAKRCWVKVFMISWLNSTHCGVVCVLCLWVGFVGACWGWERFWGNGRSLYWRLLQKHTRE